jgi:predicted acyltransferase (DUF342 family)
VHRDIKQDYEHFLRNMEISEKDIPSEYILAHVMMAGRAEQVQEILDNMEVEDFGIRAFRPSSIPSKKKLTKEMCSAVKSSS